VFVTSCHKDTTQLATYGPAFPQSLISFERALEKVSIQSAIESAVASLHSAIPASIWA